MFSINIGSTDKIIRIIAGIVILILGYVYHTWWGLIGIVPILTVITGRCVLYYLFGINTCKLKDK